MRSIIALAVIGTLLFVSCKPEPLGPSMRYDLLTNGKWQLWHFQSVINNPGMPDTINNYNLLPNCAKDDYMVFGADSAVFNYSGPIKCNNEPDEVLTAQKWHFLNADTELQLKDTSQTLLYAVTLLNDTTLRLKLLDSANNIKTVTEAYYHNIN